MKNIIYRYKKVNEKSVPISLSVYGRTFNYPDDKLFENLKDLIPCEMTSIIEHNGKEKSSDYLVTGYYLNDKGTPTIKCDTLDKVNLQEF